MQATYRLEIGAIGFSIQDQVADPTDFRDDIKKFLTTYQSETQVSLKIHNQSPPDLNKWTPVFHSGGIWRLWQRDQTWTISLSSEVLEPKTYQVATFSHNYLSGDVYIPPHVTGKNHFSFDQALGEILTVHLLARGRGVLLHSFGVIDGQTGRLFVGVSGDGKSTSARLWEKEESVCILSDDRIIVRKHQGRFWMYGTPWHGEAGLASNQSAPIEQIFILKHASQNQVLPLSPADATARLLVRSFPTFWDPAGMDFTLSFLAELSQTIPCYELGFRPEPEVIDFVRSLPDR